MNTEIQKVSAETFAIIRSEVIAGKVSEKECFEIAESYDNLARMAKYRREHGNEILEVETSEGMQM